MFGDIADRIYPTELNIKETTDTVRSHSYPEYNIEIEGRLRRKRYDNRDYFNYVIVNFPFLCSNIPAAPVYGVYISQVIQHSRARGSYHDFHDRGLLRKGSYCMWH